MNTRKPSRKHPAAPTTATAALPLNHAESTPPLDDPVEPVQATIGFSLRHAEAIAVFLAGSFNGWNPTATPLTKIRPDTWEVELALPPGRHEYLFVVDGRWLLDPSAWDYCLNPHGGLNAVVQV